MGTGVRAAGVRAAGVQVAGSLLPLGKISVISVIEEVLRARLPCVLKGRDFGVERAECVRAHDRDSLAPVEAEVALGCWLCMTYLGKNGVKDQLAMSMS